MQAVVKTSHKETANIFETDWYRDIKSRMTPGNNLRIYRENRGLTQAKLGEMLPVSISQIWKEECGRLA